MKPYPYWPIGFLLLLLAAPVSAQSRDITLDGMRSEKRASMTLPPTSRRGAAFVDKILRGVKPADLPIEQSTQVDLVINLNTAKSLGLTIPPSLLMRAVEVIE